MFSSAPPARKWAALAILSVAQLLVVLGESIVNVALPQMRTHLDLTDLQSQWVIVAYALAFGALLLLGGRIADYWGRKRTFLLGLAGYGAASVVGGLAQGGLELVIARGFQGAFAALMAPAALALLTVTFPTGRDRNTAFAIFGIVAATGAGIGMVLGGVLTELTDWRWCLLINAPIALVAIGLGLWLIPESRATGDRHFDIPGTVLIVAGLGALVYGFTLAEHSWTAPDTLGFVAAGIVLVAVFVLVERKTSHPLLPLGIFASKVRAGAFLLQAIGGSVTIGATVFLAYHLQLVLGLSPLIAGLATLPMPLASTLVAPIAARLLGRFGPRWLMIAGPLFGAAGLGLITFITPDGNYFAQVLPGLILTGMGLALLLVPLQNVALLGVAPHDAGAAGGAVNAFAQIGGSLGLSIFSAVAASAQRTAPTGADTATVLVAGYAAAFTAAAIALLVGAVLAFILIRPTTPLTTGTPTAPLH